VLSSFSFHFQPGWNSLEEGEDGSGMLSAIFILAVREAVLQGSNASG